MFGGGKNQYNYLPLLGLFVLQMLQFCKFGSIYLIFFMRMKDFDFGWHQPIFGINIISIGIFFFLSLSVTIVPVTYYLKPLLHILTT